MATRRGLTELQRATLRRLLDGDPQAYQRARSAGERVTLASLVTRGYAERRAWRGAEGQADSAYEYRPTAAMSLAWCLRRAASEPHRLVDELVSRRAS